MAQAMPTMGLIESSKDLAVHDSPESVVKFCVRGRAGFPAARDVIPRNQVSLITSSRSVVRPASIYASIFFSHASSLSA